MPGQHTRNPCPRPRRFDTAHELRHRLMGEAPHLMDPEEQPDAIAGLCKPEVETGVRVLGFSALPCQASTRATPAPARADSTPRTSCGIG